MELFSAIIAFYSISNPVTVQCGKVFPWPRKEVHLLCVNETQENELGGDSGSRLKLLMDFLDILNKIITFTRKFLLVLPFV